MHKISVRKFLHIIIAMLLVSTFAFSTAGVQVTRAVSTIVYVDAGASGTGNLYWWDASLNGGLGDWALAQSGVSYTINFYDSGKSGKSSTDSFGIRIVYTPVAPQPSTLPNSTSELLKGGDIKIR